MSGLKKNISNLIVYIFYILPKKVEMEKRERVE